MTINVFAVAISASVSAHFDSLYGWAVDEGCAPRSTIWGKPVSSSPSNSALLNGWLAHLQVRKKKKKKRGLLLEVCVYGVVICVLYEVLCCRCLKKKKKTRTTMIPISRR